MDIEKASIDSDQNVQDLDVTHEGWIPKEYISTFEEYRYISPHKTYLEGVVLDKLWEWMINYMPRWIAPNLITVSGLVIVTIGLLALLWEDPNMTEQVSTWIYIYLAFSIWVYQTLDCLDGKQARRTGSSSVLGELFDHGCDAVVCVFLAIIYCHVLSFGAGYKTGVGILFQAGIFTMFTYEKRFTYVLRTALGEFGTIEAHYLYMLILILRAIFGPRLAFAKVEYLSNLLHFDFNLQNVATILGKLIFIFN